MSDEAFDGGTTEDEMLERMDNASIERALLVAADPGVWNLPYETVAEAVSATPAALPESPGLILRSAWPACEGWSGPLGSTDLSPLTFIHTGLGSPLMTFLNTRGQDKVIFGTDFPVIDFGRATPEVSAMELKPEAKRKLLRDNAIRVFKFASPASM
jgi:hypothetical protein